MKSSLRHTHTSHWRPGKAALAGILATLVYSITMESDKLLFGNHFSDVRFIQGLLEGKKARSRRFSLLAWVIHFLNGIALAEIYAAFAKRWLPGPNWFKGALFAELFITGAWWLTPLADKHHPLITDGELPKLATWTAFWQNVVRHLAFGLTLGMFYRNGREPKA